MNEVNEASPASGAGDLERLVRLPSKYEHAVKNPDGSLYECLAKVGGKSFSCACGCNVFHKPDKAVPELYRCNACETMYKAT